MEEKVVSESYPMIAIRGEFPFPRIASSVVYAGSAYAKDAIDKVRNLPDSERLVALIPVDLGRYDEFDIAKLARVGVLGHLDSVEEEVTDGEVSYACRFGHRSPAHVISSRSNGIGLEATLSLMDEGDIGFDGADGHKSFGELHPIIADTIELFKQFRQTLPLTPDDYELTDELLAILDSGDSFRQVTDLLAFFSELSFGEMESLFLEEDLLRRYYPLNAHFRKRLGLEAGNFPPVEELFEGGRLYFGDGEVPLDLGATDGTNLFETGPFKNASIVRAMERHLMSEME